MVCSEWGILNWDCVILFGGSAVDWEPRALSPTVNKHLPLSYSLILDSGAQVNAAPEKAHVCDKKHIMKYLEFFFIYAHFQQS